MSNSQPEPATTVPTASSTVAAGEATGRVQDDRRAALAFIEKRFPGSPIVLLFGSSTRNQASSRSDLDLMVIRHEETDPNYHENFETEGGLQLDVVAFSIAYCQAVVQHPPRWHRDHQLILLLALSDGMMLKDEPGIAPQLQRDARAAHKNGPAPLTSQEQQNYRQEVTELFDDFHSTRDDMEAVFLSHALTMETGHLLMGIHRRWSPNDSKWFYRFLRDSGIDQAQSLLRGLDVFLHTRNRRPLHEAVDSILALAGGRLFAGRLCGVPPGTPKYPNWKHVAHRPFRSLRRLKRWLQDGVY